MPKRTDLALLEANTETVRETITDDDTGDAVNLTGRIVEFLIKPNDLTADAAPTVVVLSTETGEIAVTDPAAGVCTVTIPPQQPGTYWRRLDVVDGDDRRTAIYGPLHVVSV